MRPDRIAEPAGSQGTTSTISGRTKTHVRGIWRRTTIADYDSEPPALADAARHRRAGQGQRQELGVEGRGLHAAHSIVAWCGCRPAAAMPSSSANTTRRPENSSRMASRCRRRNPAPTISTTTRSCSTPISDRARMTASGYPRIVKLWHRGEKIARPRPSLKARLERYVAPARACSTGPYGTVAMIAPRLTFFTGETFVVTARWRHVKLPLPDSMRASRRDRGPG